MSFDIIQNTDKVLTLENTTKNILNCNQQISILKKHYRNIGLSFPIHSFANFRDGFVHFDKIYTSLIDSECECQKYAFDEHLQRCTKDACVLLADMYLSVFTELLVSSNLNRRSVSSFLEEKTKTLENCEFIFDSYPQLKDDITVWTIENLDSVCLDLCDDFFGNVNLKAFDNKISREYYQKYICSCLLDYYKKNGFAFFGETELNEIRILVHRLNNHVLLIRSESSNLIKSYCSGEKDYYADFIKIVEDTYDFANKHCLLGIMYLLLGVK